MTRQSNQAYQMSVNWQTMIKFVRHSNKQVTYFPITPFDRIRARLYIQLKIEKKEKKKKKTMNTTKLQRGFIGNCKMSHIHDMFMHLFYIMTFNRAEDEEQIIGQYQCSLVFVLIISLARKIERKFSYDQSFIVSSLVFRT